MAARTKVWFNLTRNVTANVIGQIISFHFRLLWIKVGGSFFSYLDDPLNKSIKELKI